MTLNGTSTIFAPIFGKIASKLSIQFVLAIYYLFVILTGSYMLFWVSNPNTLHFLFILAILLGLIDSINSAQPRGKNVLIQTNAKLIKVLFVSSIIWCFI
jgi:hypothetical protein